MPHFRPLTMLANRLSYVQSIIVDNWKNYPQFQDDQGFGRIALLACILSTIFGVHIIVCLQLVLVNLGILSKEIDVTGLVSPPSDAITGQKSLPQTFPASSMALAKKTPPEDTDLQKLFSTHADDY